MKTKSKFSASDCKCNGALIRHLSTAMSGKKSDQLITGVHTSGHIIALYAFYSDPIDFVIV